MTTIVCDQCGEKTMQRGDLALHYVWFRSTKVSVTVEMDCPFDFCPDCRCHLTCPSSAPR